MGFGIAGWMRVGGRNASPLLLSFTSVPAPHITHPTMPPAACLRASLQAAQLPSCSVTGRFAPPPLTPAPRCSCSRRPPPAAPHGRSPPAHSARLPPPTAVRRDAARQVVCSKTLIAKEGCEEEVSTLCAGMVATLAPAPPPTGGGPAPARVRGVLDARLLTDTANPRTFHLWERYDSNRSLGEVNTGEPYAAFMRSVVPLLEGPVGMALYEWKDGQLGAPAVQGGPKGEGGLDDATGGQGMPGGAGMKQTSAAFDLGNLERGEEGDAFGMPVARAKGSASAGSDGEESGDPVNAFEEFQENLAKGLKAFKFPWEK